MTQTSLSDSNDPLILAAEAGDYEHARRALTNGSSPNVRDEAGRTALMIVIEEGWAHPGWAPLLVSAGTDVNLTDADGDTALDFAKYYGRHRSDRTIQDFLIAHGATGKTGPCAKEIRDDQISHAYQDQQAVMRLAALMSKKE